MRWTNWMLAFALVVAMAGFLAAAELNHGCTSCEQQGTHGAVACLTPGCCKQPPTACDNAWDGYCQEKARKQAFWSKFGTGSHCWCKQPARVTTHPVSTPCQPAEEEGTPEEAPESVASSQFDAKETPNPLRVLWPTGDNNVPLPPIPSVSSQDADVSMQAERPIPLPPVDQTS